MTELSVPDFLSARCDECGHTVRDHLRVMFDDTTGIRRLAACPIPRQAVGAVDPQGERVTE